MLVVFDIVGAIYAASLMIVASIAVAYRCSARLRASIMGTQEKPS
jgi:hypothetical protein